MSHLKQTIQAVWRYLREVSGEDDYPRYRARSIAQNQKPATPQAFYLERLKEKYSRISRCC